MKNLLYITVFMILIIGCEKNNEILTSQTKLYNITLYFDVDFSSDSVIVIANDSIVFTGVPVRTYSWLPSSIGFKLKEGKNNFSMEVLSGTVSADTIFFIFGDGDIRAILRREMRMINFDIYFYSPNQ